MKTIVIYQSKYGASQEVANCLKGENTTCVSLRDFDGNLQEYEQVVLGCGVYAGSLAKAFKEFCVTNEEALCTKKLFFYFCGLQKEKEDMYKVCQENLTPLLRDRADAKMGVGGMLNFPRMNFMEKSIIKMINKKAHFVSKEQMKDKVDLLDYEKIEELKAKL